MIRALLLGALLIGCGAPKPRSERREAAPESAAPASEAPEAPLPDPTAADAPIVPVGEEAFAGAGQVFPDALDLFTLEQNHRNSMAATGREERAKHAFWLERIAGESARRRQVHCSTAQVITEVEGPAAPMPIGLPADAPDPTGRWVIRVGDGGKATPMVQYRHIVKHHRLEYLGRTRDGQALYRYLAPRRVPGQER